MPAKTAAAIARYGDHPCCTFSTAMIAAAKPAHRADREVDLAEQQHEHDPDRDQAHRSHLQDQVRQVDRAHEARLLDVEDDPDHRQREDDAQLREVARHEAPQELELDCGPRRPRRPLRRPCSSLSPPFPDAPVIAATTWSWLVCRSNSPAVGRGAARRSDRRPRHVREVVADHHARRGRARACARSARAPARSGARRGRGRLVEDDQLRLAQQRARDRDRLALAARQVADVGAHARDRHAEVVEQLARLLSIAPRRAGPTAGRLIGDFSRPRTGSRRCPGCRTARGPGRRSRSRGPPRPRAGS